MIFAQKNEWRSKKSVVIHDLGSGSGDGLRAIANWGRRRGHSLQITGLDANRHIVDYARKEAADFPEIDFEVTNVFDSAYQLDGVDVATFNLCLHHFSDQDILELLQKCKTGEVKAILINDLHRHWLAYYLFMLVCIVFRSPKIARLDGLLSIRKGFKKSELLNIAQQLAPSKIFLRWRWAFRYQFILLFD